jgi:hypothetical protein
MNYQIIPLKTTEELLQWLSENYDVAPLPLSTFSKPFIEGFKFTILHSISHQANPALGDELHFISYRLFPTERNQKYFKSYRKYLGDLIYLIIEPEHRCLTSNCYRLDLEVRIAWGLSEYDRENRTIFYKEYTWLLDCFAELNAQ